IDGRSSTYCPNEWCVCDIYLERNRANCSSQNLLSADIGMSKHVEILDLSNNFLSTLDEHSFSDLKHLQTLNLSNNSIHTIDIDTFSKLKRLEHLILSKNRLESFDNRIIEKLNRLVTLDLSENKFMDLRNAVLLKSRSVETLDLQNSQITHLYASLFQRMTNLKTINLSNNLLITLNISPFLQLNRLKFVNLNGNKLICDGNMQTTLRWMQNRRISVLIENCSIKSESMFERMRMEPALEAVNASTPSPVTTQKSSSKTHWKFHKKSPQLDMQLCPLNDTERACDLYESCMGNFSSFIKTSSLKKGSVQADDAMHQSSIQSTRVSFVVGLCIGLLFGASIMFVITSIAQMFTKKNSIRLRRRNAMRDKNRNRGSNMSSTLSTDVPIIDVIDEPITDTRRTRRQQRGARSHQNRQLVRSNSIPFLTRIFERPARRRQLYRSLNQNATNLVRRLSQSRLALNLSRHVANMTTQQSPSAPPSADTTHLMENRSTEINAGVRSELHASDGENFIVSVPRSETPPPPYGDIIENKN
ncbi:Slit like 3 protein, partial [Pseudolycoriella hygida]